MVEIIMEGKIDSANFRSRYSSYNIFQLYN